MNSVADIKNKIIADYGVKLEIPAFYITEAKMCPHPGRSNMFIQVVYYVLPDSDSKIDTLVKTYKPGSFDVQTSLLQTFINDQDELVEDITAHQDKEKMFKYCSLKLMSMRDGILNEEQEIVIETRYAHSKITIEFSPDGRFFAILCRLDKSLKIFEIRENEEDGLDQMKELFLMINNGATYVEFGEKERQKKRELREKLGLQNFKDSDFEYANIKRLEFDANSLFLIVYGKKELSVISLREENQTDVVESFEVDTNYFTKIIDCQMVSFNDIENEDEERPNVTYPYELHIACRQKDENCVVLFKIEEGKNQKTVNVDRSLNFFSDNEDTLDVKISENFKQAVLVNKTENYILYQENEEWH